MTDYLLLAIMVWLIVIHIDLSEIKTELERK